MGNVAVADVAGTVSSLRAQLAQMQGRRVDAPVLPVPPALAALLPGGGLRPGAAYALGRSSSLLFSLFARPSQEGSWCAAVGMPHLGAEAARAAGVGFGRVTAEIGVAVSGSDADLAVKRDAMLAHASQIVPGAVPAAGFADAYGYEWFLRGERAGGAVAPGVLDALGNAHLLAGAR